jgi:hypothetical protein
MSLDNNYPNRKVNMKNRLKKLGFKKYPYRTGVPHV